MHLAQRRGDDLHVRDFVDDAVDHVEEGAGIQLRPRGDLGTGDAQPLLQILFVPDEHVDVLDDPRQHGTARLASPVTRQSFSR